MAGAYSTIDADIMSSRRHGQDKWDRVALPLCQKRRTILMTHDLDVKQDDAAGNEHYAVSGFESCSTTINNLHFGPVYHSGGGGSNKYTSYAS